MTRVRRRCATVCGDWIDTGVGNVADLRGGDGDALPAPIDCWNRIGVRGDGSCPELARYAHCRSCPTYSAAALTLLEREPPAEYLADRTAHFAQESEREDPDIRSAVTFRIGSEWFALPTLLFDEVADPGRLHSLPHLRDGAVLGLVNVHGELLICVSLGKLLGVQDGEAPDRSAGRRLVVIRHESGRLAFPADEVAGTYRYHAGDLKAVPGTVAKAATPYTQAVLAWRGRNIGYLDGPAIVDALNGSIR
jgi:chemotaxis-related protein WspD